MGRLLVVVVLAAALAAPAGALAQGSNPLTPVSPTQQPAPVSVQLPASGGSGGDRGLTTWQETLIFIGGVLLIGGIGAVIVRDARRRAPVRAGEAVAAAPHHNRTAGKRDRDRARARAARSQRRKNR